VKHKRIAGSGTVLLLIAGAATLISRGKTPNMAGPELPEVQVATVEHRDLPIEHEWIGTLDGLVNAEIRAEVTGYLLRQAYQEGSFVRKSQLWA
jgi:multidrug efflux pump subunit AcrA (membrane-fusion protein)